MKDVSAIAVQHSPFEMEYREENLDFIISKIRYHAELGADLIVFPEVGITNFFRHEPGGLEKYWIEGAISLQSEEIKKIREVAKTCGVYTVVGFAEKADSIGTIYNTAALIGPKGIEGIARKNYMPGLEKFYYSRGGISEVFDTEVGKIGIVICYDSMFPENFISLSMKGAEIIVITSSIWAGGDKGGVGDKKNKQKYWSVLPVVSAIQSQTFVVSANACGRLNMGADVGTWERLGLSKIVSPTGEVLAEANVEDDVDLKADLKVSSMVKARTSYRFVNDRLLYGEDSW
ncbi:MAG: carbon-nitrogen hydrolase family protein [Pseudomonadota bacterium]